jgi:SAM-dependent methyltransferase
MLQNEQVRTKVSGYDVWCVKFEGDSIPGSTRIPIREIREYYNGQTADLNGLDLGSGSGRGSELLERELGAKVTALDLSHAGLINTRAESRVQANGIDLPFADEAFDFAVICGVMTNLTDREVKISQDMRRRLAEGAKRCTKSGGVVIVSDFSSDHTITGYPVDYRRHALITGEIGTIAVFDPKAKVSFRGLSDDEVKRLIDSPFLVRFAHHYSSAELAGIFMEAGFTVPTYQIEIGQTPSGNPIENIIMTAVNPKK